MGKAFFVGEATEVSENNAKTICNVVWADLESWNSFLKPAYTNVIGSYPQKKEEILLSERALKKLGISEPEQGMEINLDVYKGAFEHSKENSNYVAGIRTLEMNCQSDTFHMTN